MLGKLKKVSLREIWKNEAYDFTPWLAENIDQLAEAIGIELEFIDKEVSVGSYSADILAKDTGTDKFVVIENQLEKTNHDHLGKCVTYASVLDASAIIWIASKFTDEHKKALDWLNDHTSDEIGFYGLQIELWKIDHSQPAIRFNVISQPNEVVRQVSQRKNQTELSQTRKTQLEFWTMFRDKLSKKKQIRSLQSPRPQYWFDIALGKAGIVLSNTFNTEKNELGVRIYIQNNKADEWLPYFESKKDIIENEIGEKLQWNPNPNNRDKIIGLSKKFDLDNKENWNEAINWLIEMTLKFYKIFSKLIKEKSQQK